MHSYICCPCGNQKVFSKESFAGFNPAYALEPNSLNFLNQTHIIPTLESLDPDSQQTDEVPGGHVYAYQVGPTIPLLEMALNFKQGAIVDLLIDSGYEINFRDWYVLVGQGPKRFDTLVKGFLAKGRDINTLQKHRHGLWTPLHWLAQRGLTEGIACLLANGADPNVKDDKHRTPMHIIAQKGVGKNQVQLLIEHGGDINSRDAHGKTPRNYAQKAKKKSVKNFLTEYANQAQKSI